MHYSTSRAFHWVVTWEQVLSPEIQDSLTRLPCHIAFSCLLHGLHCFQKGKWVHLFHQNLKSKIRKGGWSKQFVSFIALIKRTGCSQFHVYLKNSQKKPGDFSRMLYYVHNVPRWGVWGRGWTMKLTAHHCLRAGTAWSMQRSLGLMPRTYKKTLYSEISRPAPASSPLPILCFPGVKTDHLNTIEIKNKWSFISIISCVS